MAKPKLALIPATQGSKFYSVLPSNGVGDFNFIRVSSATRINSQGLIEEVLGGQSRLNYPMIDGKVVGCPHHLLEPARTNLIPYSEIFYFSWARQGSGTGTAPIVTLYYSISPDGGLNASRMVFNIGAGTTSNDFSQLEESIASVGGDITNSIWIKSNTESNYKMSLVKPNGYHTSILVTPEWRRFIVYSSITGSNSSLRLRLRGNEGTSDNADVSVWGAQVEEGLYPTSYIPTNGGQVTRNAEVANGSGDDDTFNSSEGVLMYQIKADYLDDTYKRITLSDGTNTNRIIMGFDNNNNVTANVYNGTNQAVLGGDYTGKDELSKYALKYKENDFALWLNGFQVSTDTSGNTFPNKTLNQLRFEDGAGAYDFRGKIKQVQYYDSVLTDSELEQLTSWTSFTDMAQGQEYSIK